MQHPDPNVEQRWSRFLSMADQAHSAIAAKNDSKKIPSAYVCVLDTLVELGISALARVLSHQEAEALHGRVIDADDDVSPSVGRLMERGYTTMSLGDEMLLHEAGNMAQSQPGLLQKVAPDMSIDEMSPQEKRIMALRLMMIGAMQVRQHWMQPALKQVLLEKKGVLQPAEDVDPATFPSDDEDDE